MPKKIKNITNFSGGFNNNTNPRDLLDGEFQELLNISNEVPGKLTPIGVITSATRSDGSTSYTSAISDIDALNYGNGLVHVNLDRNIGSASTIDENEYIFINDKNDSIVRIVNLTDGALESDTIDYGNTASLVDMYSIDGSVRVIPYYGNAGNTPKVYEFFNVSRKLGTGTTNDIANTIQNTYRTSNIHIAPLKGNGTYNYDIEKLYLKSSHFDPTYGSEVFMPGSCVVGNIETANDADRFDQTAIELDTYLDNWATYGTYNNTEGKGSMAVIAYFPNKTSADDTSNITVYKDKKYGLFVSKLYANYDTTEKAESPAVYIGDVPQNATPDDIKQNMYLGLVGRMGDKDSRYAGFKIYWALIDNFETGTSIDTGSVGNKYLLSEVDFEKGIRFAGEDTYNVFGEDTLDGAHQFVYPANIYSAHSDNLAKGYKLDSLPILEPYIIEGASVIGEANTGFKTSTIINRRVYAGNVQYYDKKHNLVTKSDRVLKSKPNEFDYFEEASYIDAELEDGDRIIKLSSVANKLLEFKQNKLFIINVGRGIEFLEGSYDHKGVSKDFHVTSGEGFVCWFNKFGVYLYDGQQVLELHLSDSGQPLFNNWNTTYYHDDNVIGYLPISKEIIIVNKNGNILKYDLKSESWHRGDNFTTDDISNTIIRNNGILNYAYEVAGLSGNPDTVQLKAWDNNPSSFTESSNKTIIKTKEFDLDNPSAQKNINTIYINYKEGDNLFIKGFSVKSTGASQEDYLGSSEQALTNTTSGFQTQKIDVTNSDFKNLSSFGLIIYARGGVNANFVLNDIQIVYREMVNR